MHRHNSEFTFEARHEPSFVCQGMNVHLLIWLLSHFLFRHESGKGQFMRSHSALLHRRTMLVILNVVRVVDRTDVIKFLALQNWWSGWEMWNVWCADAPLDLFLRIFGRTPAHTFPIFVFTDKRCCITEWPSITYWKLHFHFLQRPSKVKTTFVAAWRLLHRSCLLSCTILQRQPPIAALNWKRVKMCPKFVPCDI